MREHWRYVCCQRCGSDRISPAQYVFEWTDYDRPEAGGEDVGYGVRCETCGFVDNGDWRNEEKDPNGPPG